MKIEELYSVFKKHPVICTDTRDITEGSIFFALKGANFNGNTFAGDALKKGASFVVLDEEKYKLDSRYILVEDVLTILQHLATHHRRQLKCPVLAITGSNGKTTTKELISAVLSKKFKTHYTRGNLNNHIGVPLTILSAAVDTEMLIVEMGANHQKEIAALCSIAEPGFGIITNVGKAHLEGFGSFNGVKSGKGELYEFLAIHDGLTFINGDNPHLAEMLSEKNRQVKRLVKYGTKNEFECSGELLEVFPFLKVKWNYGNRSGTIQTQLIGEYNFENILAAICIGNYFDISPEKINQAIEEYVPSNNRSQMIQKGSNTIILDAYNANPTSMEAALRNFAAMDTGGKEKMAMIGEMAELGADSKKEHLDIGRLISELHFDRIFLVGKEFDQPEIKNRFPVFENSQELEDNTKLISIKDFYILIKGSRSTKMEKVLDAL